MNDPKVCVISLIGKSQLHQNQTKAWKLNSLLQKNYFQCSSSLWDSPINKTKKHKRYSSQATNNNPKPTNENESSAIDVGKSQQEATNQPEKKSAESATTVMNDETNDETNQNDEHDFNLETYYDSKNRVVYIHLESFYDTNNVFDVLLQNQQSETSSKNFFELWEKEQTKYVKSILLLFSISHIIIISSPSCEFDIGYIRFFRIVDTLRNKMLPSLVDLLKSLNLPISREWIYAGRPCSPRVLFAFENCSRDILNESDSKQFKAIEKLQHSLEDQIYHSLRKSYVITNISNNSLFAIPANQEFVYVHRLTFNSIDSNRFLLSNLHKECTKSKEVNTSSSSSSSATASTAAVSAISSSSSSSINRQITSQLPNENNYSSNSIINNETLDARLFRKFVFEHIKTALNEGFNDNIGRTNVNPVFELPKLSAWQKIFDSLVDFFLKEPKTTKIQSQYAQLKAHIDIETQFSENRCKKVLPAALSLYQEGLPGHYTRVQHQQRLDKAIHLYSIQARGPMYDVYLEQLTNDCSNIWHNGRQLCEAISLTGHPCVYELHKVLNEENQNDNNNNNENESNSENETTSNNKLITNDDSATNSQDNRDDEESVERERIPKRRYARNKSLSDRESSSRRGNKEKSERHSSNGSTSDASNGESRNNSSKTLPAKNHNSNIITIAASNCGEFQLERRDPFDLKEANFTFYEEFTSMASSAKKKHIKYEFQIFKPTSSNFKPDVQLIEEKEKQTHIQMTQPFSASNLSNLNLSQEVSKISRDASNVQMGQTNQNEMKQTKENDILFSSPFTDQQQANQKHQSMADGKSIDEHVSSIVPGNNQQSISPVRTNLLEMLKLNPTISTEVYLSGMTHTDSTPGLLPRFSSWSLVSIGKSSQYNAHTGLNQPGFLSNHNYLIPWDIVVNKGNSSILTEKQISNSRRIGTNQSHTQSNTVPVTVRAYIGMEYECPCGHRFICSGPDRIVKVSANGNVKDDAYKLLNGDMPLYTACPCRNSKDSTPYMAQMMRVFVVSPSSTINFIETTNSNSESKSKSSSPIRRNISPTLNNNNMLNQQNKNAPTILNISLRPRVQPNPLPCPIFIPSHDGSITLTENSIWVLRLPYIYMSDNGKPYYRPKDFETLNNCRVLKGMFSVVLNSSDLNK